MLQLYSKTKSTQSLSKFVNDTLGSFDSSTGLASGLLGLLMVVGMLKTTNTTTNGVTTYSTDTTGSVFNTNLSNTQAQASANTSNILALQTDNTPGKSFLSAMLSNGFITQNANAYALTTTFVQAVSATNASSITSLQTDNNSNKTFLSAMVSSGLVALSNNTYSLTPTFVKILSNTSNKNSINTVLKNCGVFSSDFTESTLAKNFVTKYLIDYGPSYGYFTLLPPYKEHLYGYWYAQSPYFLRTNGQQTIGHGSRITSWNSAYDSSKYLNATFTSNGNTFITGPGDNGKTGYELYTGGGGLVMSNISWNDPSQAGVYTHCLLFRNYGDSYSLGAAGTIILTDSSGGGYGMQVAVSQAGVYCQVGNGRQFRASQSPIPVNAPNSGIVNPYINTVVLKAQTYYLLIYTYGPGADIYVGWGGSNVNNSPGSGQPGTWQPNQVDNWSNYNTSYQCNLYINGVNCGKSAAWPPSYNGYGTNTNSYLSLGSAQDNSNGPYGMSIVSYSLYKFAFTQTEVNNYYNYVKTLYPLTNLQAPF